MKVYKLEVIVIDHNEVGDEIGFYLENANFPNDCINPHVVSSKSIEIGEWSDDHPLNSTRTFESEIQKLFPKE